MKRNKKWWIVAAVLLLIAAVAFFALRWAWKYYGLPERPDRTEYKTIEERAEKALAFAQRHNMSERYALFVDYGIPSGTPRLFLWDFRRKAIVASTYVMHGPGRGSTAKTPHFSNRPGSECSSLGRFLVTKERGHKIKRSFRLKGMDTDNQSAFKRGLMIHSARWVGSMVLERINYPSQPRVLSGVRDDLYPRHGSFVATDQSRAQTAAFVEF